MSGKLKDMYTYAFEKIIKKHTAINTNSIFVLCGMTPYIQMEKFNDYVTDKDTFDKEGNLDLFFSGMVRNNIP